MSMPFQITKSFSFGGKTFPEQRTISSNTGLPFEKSLPAAKTGTVSVKTDANTGTLVLQSGHGVTTGARLDIYWAGGCRRGMVVGTVSGTSVPVDLGAGTDLPVATTVITAMVPVAVDFVAETANIVAWAMFAEARAQITVADAANAEVYSRELALSSGHSECWYTGNGTNPITADIVTLYVSHADSTAARTIRVAIAYN